MLNDLISQKEITKEISIGSIPKMRYPINGVIAMRVPVKFSLFLADKTPFLESI